MFKTGANKSSLLPHSSASDDDIKNQETLIRPAGDVIVGKERQVPGSRKRKSTNIVYGIK